MKETITNTNNGKTYTIEEAPIEELKAVYESVCDEYRRRLCKMFEIDIADTWWIADKYDELVFPDWVMLMPEVKYCVENGITYGQVREYWTFMVDEAHEGRKRPRISFYAWMRGARPEILKDDGEHKENQEKIEKGV